MIFVKNSITQLKRVVTKIDVWSHLSINFKNELFLFMLKYRYEILTKSEKNIFS